MTTKGSNNPFPSVLLNEVATDGSDTPTPAADYRRLFLGEDGALHLIDSADVVTNVAGTGDVATDAIWDAAGDLAVGTGANTAARLAKGADGSVLGMSDGAVAWIVGTSFPATPNDGDIFHRSDLPCGWYRYVATGTKWLCMSQHRLEWNSRTAWGSGGIAATTGSMQNAASATGDSSDMWIDDFSCTMFVLTTNDASNYWTATLAKLDAANSATTVGTCSPQSNTASNWVEEKVDVDAFVVSGTYIAFRIDTTKVLTPGNLIAVPRVLWRHGFDV